MKTFSLSVIDFALPAPRTGSIDVYSGFGRCPSIGTEIHQEIQQIKKKTIDQYEAEVPISQSLSFQNNIFHISGRMDGVYRFERTLIEEIKSSFNIFELRNCLLDAQNEHPFCLQLKTYGYFHWLQTKEIPHLSFHLVSTRNGDTYDLTLPLNIEHYETWLNRRLQELDKEVKAATQTGERRQRALKKMTFPFAALRPGQAELIQTVREGMHKHQPMLLQAPTGLGKTIGVLYPVFEEAMQRGQKVIYVTPKNSQQAIAEEALDRLRSQGMSIKSLTLTAKAKMCFKSETLCNPKYCEFAKDHYTKVSEHHLAKQLYKKRRLTADIFKSIAKKYEVCPFELQFEAIKQVDVIICDYNYVFAPRAALGQATIKNISEEGKHNLIIDEAHNLPSRALDYYSSSLSVTFFEKMLKEVEKVENPFRKKVERLLNECIAIVTRCGTKESKHTTIITPPVQTFITQDEKLRDFLSKYLNTNVTIKPGDLILGLSYYWSEFTAALEFITPNRPEFFATFKPHPATVKIICCDASTMLKPSYKEYAHMVAFSATLKPFSFYSQLSGLDVAKVITTEFKTPFPSANRKILLIPQVSSRYVNRERHYPRFAEIIEKITSLRLGNYFVFFPSFDFLERTWQLFKPNPCFEVLRQERNMHREDVRLVLERLKTNKQPCIVFAVQGGIFSEGIDYPGEMIIGAFIIGTALPNFDLEREQMKKYYQQHYFDGKNFAYIYPAMAKAIQAAGRVIRSETDKGLIVLMDDRYLDTSYSKCMPDDWYDTSPTELISTSILKDISDFWSSNV